MKILVVDDHPLIMEDIKKPVFAAMGDGGNLIYVNTEKKITVGVTGTFRPRIFDRVDFVEKNVLPVIEK